MLYEVITTASAHWQSRPPPLPTNEGPDVNILLIEDDVDLAGTLIQYLELAGYSCDHAGDGLRGLNLLQRNHYDVRNNFV